MSKPLISVIMPIYRDAPYVGAALSSVLIQTLGDFELIAVADAGTDDATLSIVKDCSDPRVRTIRATKPLTVAGALNLGLDEAKGEYVARMDADDIALEQRFEKQAAYLQNHADIGLCGSWCDLFGSENWQFRTPTDSAELECSLVFGCIYIHPSVMWRRDAFADGGLRYNGALSATEDYDLWFRAAAIVNLGTVPEVLLRYRKHANAATARHGQEGRARYQMIQRMALDRLGYRVDEESLAFHYRYSTAGLNSTEDLLRLRKWLHWLWLSVPGTHRRDPAAMGRVCARRWFDACSSAACAEKYQIFRSSALTRFLDNGVVHQFAVDSNVFG